MKPIGVLVNPAANRGRGNDVGAKVFSLLKAAGIETVSLTSESGGCKHCEEPRLT